MKFQVDVLNRQRKIRVSTDRLAREVRGILRALYEDRRLRKFNNLSSIEVSVVLVGERKMRELNARYRGKDSVTDVLSFSVADDKSYLEGLYLGEIIICPAKAKEQSKLYRVTLWQELRRLLIHGVLHLLGYDHERSAKEQRKMRNLEEKILSQLKP